MKCTVGLMKILCKVLTNRDFFCKYLECIILQMLVRERSELNKIERARTMPPTLRAKVPVAHNYSSQSLNSTEMAKELLRQHLAKVCLLLKFYIICPTHSTC